MASSSSCCPYQQLLLLRPKTPNRSSFSAVPSSSFSWPPSLVSFPVNSPPSSSSSSSSSSYYSHSHSYRPRLKMGIVAAAKTTPVDASKRSANPAGKHDREEKKNKAVEEKDDMEVEEDLPWIQEKALDLVEFTGSVTQAIPGPRIGQSSFPWILALPLAYAAVTFVVAFVKTVNKFSSPKHKRRMLVNKNAMLCRSIDELLQKGEDALQYSALKGLEKKTGFSMEDILRKYIRYALNEKPFTPELVATLIQLRKASSLDDSQVAEILNEISRRIVREKGPVVMDISGYTKKGFKRKLAVQALFGKMFYLSELPEFCSRDNSLVVKEIFGVADEDAEKLRLHTLSEAGDVDSLEKMVEGSDSEDSSENSSSNP